MLDPNHARRSENEEVWLLSKVGPYLTSRKVGESLPKTVEVRPFDAALDQTGQRVTGLC